METEFLRQVDNDVLRDLFETCVDSVEIQESTIPNAGRGLFATKDIPKDTIVAFYAVHSIGCKFPSGQCQSVQRTSDPQIDSLLRSQYTIFSYGNRPLCGVDLQETFDAKLYYDMNPRAYCPPGWYAGMINDAAMVQYLGDLTYYPRSRSRQNVEHVPFGTAPFNVGITTRDVQQGEELFVSYGYSYWANANRHYETTVDEETAIVLQQQEHDAVMDIWRAMDAVDSKYHEASWVLAQIFDHEMSSGQPPSLHPPTYQPRKRSRRQRIQERIQNLFS